MKSKPKKYKKEDIGRIFLVGSILIGLGLGLLFGQVGVGGLIGLGVGFILLSIIKANTK